MGGTMYPMLVFLLSYHFKATLILSIQLPVQVVLGDTDDYHLKI